MTTADDAVPAITEAKFTRLCVDFANTGQLKGVLLRVPGVRLLVAIDQKGEVLPDGVHGNLPTPELEALRKRLQAHLAAITHDRPISLVDLKKLSAAASRTSINPVYSISDNGALETSYRYLPESIEAAISYGVLLMVDTERPYRRDLKRCCLPACSRYFFSSDSPAATGRDRVLYCSRDHMIERHKSTSAERTRRWRERRTERLRVKARLKKEGLT
jgi:hypothetical protein